MLRIEPVYRTYRQLTLIRTRTVLSRIKVASLEIRTTRSLKTLILKDSATTDKISYSRSKAILVKVRQCCSIESFRDDFNRSLFTNSLPFVSSKPATSTDYNY